MPNQKELKDISLDSLIKTLPGVIVEDITDLVEWYVKHLINPITNQQYEAEQITRIMCAFPKTNWERSLVSQLYMECYLLRETISDLRLDAIQYNAALNDIELIIDKDINNRDYIHEDIDAVIKLARDAGV